MQPRIWQSYISKALNFLGSGCRMLSAFQSAQRKSEAKDNALGTAYPTPRIKKKRNRTPNGCIETSSMFPPRKTQTLQAVRGQNNRRHYAIFLSTIFY